MLDVDFVIPVRDDILKTEPGLPRFAALGGGGVKASLPRVRNDAKAWMTFWHSGLVRVRYCQGQAFNDANKRTSLYAPSLISNGKTATSMGRQFWSK